MNADLELLKAIGYGKDGGRKNHRDKRFGENFRLLFNLTMKGC